MSSEFFVEHLGRATQALEEGVWGDALWHAATAISYGGDDHHHDTEHILSVAIENGSAEIVTEAPHPHSEGRDARYTYSLRWIDGRWLIMEIALSSSAVAPANQCP